MGGWGAQTMPMMRTAEQDFLDDVNDSLWKAGLIAAVVALVVGLVLTRQITRPVQALMSGARHVARGELSFRVKVKSRDEIGELADSFNTMASSLEKGEQSRRQLAADIAHELRTPISVMSAQAQRLMLDGPSVGSDAAALQLIASEADRMGALVRVLLDFARSDSGRLQLELASMDPEALVLEAYERLIALAPSRIHLAPPTSESLPLIHVDPQRLQQCFAALVDNALKFSTGPLTLSVELAQGCVVFHVTDSGPGIPQQEREQVLERFVRGSSSVGIRGSGIGLATVVLLMQAMQAELVIADAANGGADMQLCFRAVDRPSWR